MPSVVSRSSISARGLARIAAGAVAMILLLGLVGFGLLGGTDPAEAQWLGMEVEPLTPSMKRALGLSPEQAGVLVSDVIGAAQQAGILEGDVIVGVDGRPVLDLAGFAQAKAAASTSPSLVVVRQGRALQVPVAIGSLAAAPLGSGSAVAPAGGTGVAPAQYLAPAPTGAVAPAAAPSMAAAAPLAPSVTAPSALAPSVAAPSSMAPSLAGAPTGALAPAPWPGFDVGDVAQAAAGGATSRGVVVTRVDVQGAAAQAGLAPSDVIVHANGWDVLTRAQFLAGLAAEPASAPLVLDVLRAGQFVQLQLAPASGVAVNAAGLGGQGAAASAPGGWVNGP